MAQHSSLCWWRDQLTQPCSAPAVCSFSPSPKAGWGPWAGAALRCLELCLFPVLLLFLLSSAGVWEGWVISSPHLCRLWSPLPCLHTVCRYLGKREKVSACRTWPGAGQPAEGGQSCGSSWQGLPAEWEPRRSVSQSWAYHRHCSLCSQPL